MSEGPGLVWFRRDLRVEDNPAWDLATREHKRVTPLYLLDEQEKGRAGIHQRPRLKGELAKLDSALSRRGGRLRIVSGGGARAVAREVNRVGATAVYTNHVIDPTARQAVEQLAKASPVPVRTSFGSHARDPGTVLSGQGRTHRVFSAFHRAWLEAPLRARPAPGNGVPTNDPEIELGSKWDDPLAGTDAAIRRVHEFLPRMAAYPQARDLVAIDGTSQLSEALAFGSISPLQILDEIGDVPDRAPFVRQLAWRDWFAHQLWENPAGFTSAMNPMYDAMAWESDEAALVAWQTGRTGLPLVDAGMRQLLQTGRMHNRARMVTASFLTKHLLIDWRVGESYFREMLVDADAAQNVGNWQWIAGSGFDAAPYFRIFNPVRQSERFDPRGDYIRTWVPELVGLSDRDVHQPWKSAARTAGQLGGYPDPIVSLDEGRERALAENQRLREAWRSETSDVGDRSVMSAAGGAR